MLVPTTGMKIFMALKPIDMRKSKNGLIKEINRVYKENAKSGNLYMFRNINSDIVKALFWHIDGFVLITKWFENNNFQFPMNETGQKMRITSKQFKFIFSGLNIDGKQKLISKDNQ